MKQESLVIVKKCVTVNIQSDSAHTAHHARGIKLVGWLGPLLGD